MHYLLIIHSLFWSATYLITIISLFFRCDILFDLLLTIDGGFTPWNFPSRWNIFILCVFVFLKMPLNITLYITINWSLNLMSVHFSELCIRPLIVALSLPSWRGQSLQPPPSRQRASPGITLFIQSVQRHLEHYFHCISNPKRDKSKHSTWPTWPH